MYVKLFKKNIKLSRENEYLKKEIKILKEWNDDLKSGMYVNCVYCGKRFGLIDKVESSMSKTLTRHIEKCKKHPLNILFNCVDNADYVFTGNKESIKKGEIKDYIKACFEVDTEK